jgi:hypothetical protein
MAERIARDRTRPDGTTLERMDLGRMEAMGWRPRIGFAEGQSAKRRLARG